MKIVKILLPIILAAALLLVGLQLYHRYSDSKYEVTIVSTLPDSFISLSEVTAENETVSYVFFEEGLFFSNNGNATHCILVKDKASLVNYQNEYYINENLLPQILGND